MTTRAEAIALIRLEGERQPPNANPVELENLRFIINDMANSIERFLARIDQLYLPAPEPATLPPPPPPP